MVIDELKIDQINTALLLLQRRLDRVIQAMNKFTEEISKCETIEDVKKLELKI
ncbi:MAG: hypothetical protein KBT21_11540 [Treponema sp.]|nr:hypothetical protein [Candidatus Treponema merdequi]